MNVRDQRLFSTGLSLLVAVLCPSAKIVCADEPVPQAVIGTQTVGLAVGPFFPIRVMPSQYSKLFGIAVLPSWSITTTDPIGSGWYQGQVSLGAELPALRTSEPVTAYGVGFTPKLQYVLVGLNRLRPYFEGGGGPLWTDLGGDVPEQPGELNFAVWGGAGGTWFLTPHWGLNIGYRFVYTSNGGTRTPNSGLNFDLPFLGVSYSIF